MALSLALGAWSLPLGLSGGGASPPGWQFPSFGLRLYLYKPFISQEMSGNMACSLPLGLSGGGASAQKWQFPPFGLRPYLYKPFNLSRDVRE